MTSPLRFSHLSISTRLALWYGLSLLILLTIFVAVLYTSVHVGLHRDFERRLREDAQAMRRHLRAHSDIGSDVLSAASFAHGGAIPSETLIRLLDEGGRVLQASSSTGSPSFTPDLPSERASTMRRRTWKGHSAQTLYLPLKASGASARWLEVTKLESALHRQLHRFRWLLVLGIVLGAGGAVGIGYGLARKALRPVAVLTRAAKQMKDRPTGTLPTDFGTKDELSDLAETFNDVFRRLREMIGRERRFRADAAHEMFTPLTAIQSEIDVTLRASRSPESYRKTLQTLRGHTEELASMLDRLMTLSRAEAREPGPASDAIDAASCIRDRVEHHRAAAIEKNVSVDVTGAETATVRVQADHLALVVDHLLDNAIKYTPEGGLIRFIVTTDDDQIKFKVSDTGPGIPESVLDDLFEAYERGENENDEEEDESAGLGLWICRTFTDALGGRLYPETTSEEGSIFVASFDREALTTKQEKSTQKLVSVPMPGESLSEFPPSAGMNS